MKEFLMHTHTALFVFSVALIGFGEHASSQTALGQTPTTLTQAGQWEMTTDMKGTPFGGGVKTGKVCIRSEAIVEGPEKALIEAAMSISQPSNSSGGETAKCSFTDIQREGGASKWKSSCTATRGVMQGTGSGTFAQDSAQITQLLEANMPFGKRTLTQSISARRFGECS
jgi:Protein of unknown function (DUF3617)